MSPLRVTVNESPQSPGLVSMHVSRGTQVVASPSLSSSPVHIAPLQQPPTPSDVPSVCEAVRQCVTALARSGESSKGMSVCVLDTSGVSQALWFMRSCTVQCTCYSTPKPFNRGSEVEFRAPVKMFGVADSTEKIIVGSQQLK
eukprot:602524-Rhodomonas_salina.1